MIDRFDLALERCEIKLNGSGRFTGYASVFDGVDSYGDTIARGAFTATLAERKRMPLMLYGHNPGRVIGKWLHLEQDEKGLACAGEFTPNHSDAQNAYASMRHGAIDGLSIGFRIPQGGAEEKSGGGRYLKSIDLVEISVVTMPADDAARIVDVKAAIDAIESLKDAEHFLREAGVARSAARDFVSRLNRVIRREGGGVSEQITKLEGADSLLRHIAALDQLLTR